MQVGTDNQNTLWHYSTHNKTKQTKQYNHNEQYH